MLKSGGGGGGGVIRYSSPPQQKLGGFASPPPSTQGLTPMFSMIPFLNRNDEKWPKIKIDGRNHILPPLGIENTLINYAKL